MNNVSRWFQIKVLENLTKDKFEEEINKLLKEGWKLEEENLNNIKVYFNPQNMGLATRYSCILKKNISGEFLKNYPGMDAG